MLLFFPLVRLGAPERWGPLLFAANSLLWAGTLLLARALLSRRVTRPEAGSGAPGA